MSPLQWALLIFGVVAVLAVYLYSRRDRRAMHLGEGGEAGESPPGPKDAQLDIFNGDNQQFDEFGVGKPRRLAPSLEAETTAQPAEADPAADREPRQQVSEKIISLLIAEREGTHILGPQIHQALVARKLEFGERQIYHRLHRGHPVFSVASLLKPGHLDPAAAASFSTPGLTLFMVLPGPQKPEKAIKDMLETAGQLAHALNAEVYDSKRKLLTAASVRSLQADVEAWAREHSAAR